VPLARSPVLARRPLEPSVCWCCYSDTNTPRVGRFGARRRSGRRVARRAARSGATVPPQPAFRRERNPVLWAPEHDPAKLGWESYGQRRKSALRRGEE